MHTITINISTTNYEFAHGSKSRGRGYWAFQFCQGGSDLLLFAPGELIYSKAKQWAIAKAVELGCNRVSVAS
jgi:hypothetical protein